MEAKVTKYASIGMSVENWAKMEAYLRGKGETRLADTIQFGVDRQVKWKAYGWINLRIRGGSIQKIEDAIEALDEEDWRDKQNRLVSDFCGVKPEEYE